MTGVRTTTLNYLVFFILLGFGITLSSYSIADNSIPPDQSQNLWENSNAIFHDIIASPLNGSGLDYGIALGFAGLTYWALQNDLDWFQAIQDHRDDLQDKLIPPINLLGDGFFHLGAYAALYQFGNSYDQKVAAMAVEGQVNVAVFSVIIKAITSSPRPATELTERDWFTFNLKNNSFPSGHTMSAFCAAAIFGHTYHCEWLTYPLAGLVGYARLYSRKHWPADVMAGAGLGLLIGHTVLAFHQHDPQDQEPGIHFSLMPEKDGGKLVVSWLY